MINTDHENDIQILVQQIWMKAVDEERYKDAIFVSFASYLLSNSRDNKSLDFDNLEMLRSTLKIVDSKIFHSKVRSPSNDLRVCYFCNRGNDALKMGSGLSGLICEECVKTFYETFFAHNID